jgi:hypothetical protein
MSATVQTRQTRPSPPVSTLRRQVSPVIDGDSMVGFTWPWHQDSHRYNTSQYSIYCEIYDFQVVAVVMIFSSFINHGFV